MGKVKKNKLNTCNRYEPFRSPSPENCDPKASPRNNIKNKLPKDDEVVDSQLASKTIKEEESYDEEDLNEDSEFSDISDGWPGIHKRQNDTTSDVHSQNDESSTDSDDLSQSERDDDSDSEDVDDEEDDTGEESDVDEESDSDVDEESDSDVDEESGVDEESYDDSDDDDDEEVEFSGYSSSECNDENINIKEEEEKKFAKFIGSNVENRLSFADYVKQNKNADFMLQKMIPEKFVTGDDTELNENIDRDMSAYKELASLLKDYESGKFPELFKSIPSVPLLEDMEQILYLTEPENWSSASVLEATYIFLNNEDLVAQRFFNTILLGRVRDKIANSMNLDTPLYHALRTALCKPSAFFKGIILPLCKAKNSTLREATILGTILASGKISYLHCSAALLTLAELEYSLANSLFMKKLFEKMYELPSRVMNAIMAHFHSFVEDKKKYPAIWHQCLLTFVQIYKDNFSVEQRNILLQLIKVKQSLLLIDEDVEEYLLTTKILRELNNSYSENSSDCSDSEDSDYSLLL